MRCSVLVVGAILAISLATTTPVMAGNCDALLKETQLQSLLVSAPNVGGDAGGLFHGTRMWGAVVDRDGTVCAFATSTADPS